MTNARVLIGLGITAGAIIIGSWTFVVLRTNGEDAATIAAGRTIYGDHCAACHGVQLEGQADWKTPLPSGRLPAPPHDASGHTWHHADEMLFRIVKEGTAAVVGGNYESDMPGFGDTLGDAEIRAVLAFIKSTWPERERGFQEEVSRRR
ncbi:cytochrome c [Brucella anthropi]|uniref:c-type cytochrome n=1 Tax=Brucella anthropi TaxID=529 RepID=UPI00244C7D33|nr:cytochrome c [Brucella anthropi]MDH0367873.1 cytochrome c [Brucella anthropi]